MGAVTGSLERPQVLVVGRYRGEEFELIGRTVKLTEAQSTAIGKAAQAGRGPPSVAGSNQHALGPGQRLADLQADLDRLNDQLELTRQALRDARKQLPRLQRAFNQAARNAAAIRKRRDTEQQRLNALEH